MNNMQPQVRHITQVTAITQVTVTLKVTVTLNALQIKKQLGGLKHG